jgi:uncharacterized protein YrrD
MTSEYIRRSELVDQLVLNRSSLEELGKVEVLWEYPQAHRVLGFICKSGSFDRTKTAFNLDQLDTIGSNGVLVNSDPVETDAERVRQIQSLVHCEVWTDTGNRVGKIVDHVFNLKNGVVRQYLLSSGGLGGFAGNIYALYPSQILSWGSRRVLVSAAIVEDLEVYQPGLQDRVSKLRNTLREERGQASQSLQSLASRAKRKAQVLAEQAREQAQILGTELLESAEQVKERVRDLGDELLEGDYREDERRRDERGVYDRYDDRDNNDFDFDDWEEAPPPRRPSEPPRQKLNLEPKQPPRTQEPRANPRRSSSDRDFDPWEDDWE